MIHRLATKGDTSLLAAMNLQLIRDEGHRNSMSLGQLQERMAGWLDGGYRAVLFEQEDDVIGYVLYKPEPEWLYLRQFFIAPDYRRQGFGRRAMNRLMSDLWKDAARIRLDVLSGNDVAIAFWRSVGFEAYCLTMERDRSRAC
ncbi:MAG: GNAT family N-acetyltransferase [Planctomycetaceae bacterium]